MSYNDELKLIFDVDISLNGSRGGIDLVRFKQIVVEETGKDLKAAA